MRIGQSSPAYSLQLRPIKGSDSDLQSEKIGAIDSMLKDGRTPDLRGVTLQQQEVLEANLSRVDRGVLQWARQQGVRIQVLQEGEELEATRALRDLTGRFEERMKPETVAQIHQHLTPLTTEIREAADPKTSAFKRKQKRNALAELLTHNPCGAAVFTPHFAPLLAPGLSKLKADPTETPTLKGLALHHGADTPEEQEKFYRWMEKLNGDRLTEAREAAVSERSQLLETRPEAKKRWLKQAEERPETVPIDTTLYTIVVPDAHYLPSTSGDRDLLLDRSDLRSVEGWRNGDFRGQWFFLEGKTNLLIRDSAVSLDTPIHELGHVVDMTLEKEEPEFYQTLENSIKKAYGLARSRGHAISEYSKANPREYIAEGFAAFYDQPQKLRKTDPALHEIITQMVDFCCRKTGINRVVDHRLQRMQRDASAL